MLYRLFGICSFSRLTCFRSRSMAVSWPAALRSPQVSSDTGLPLWKARRPRRTTPVRRASVAVITSRGNCHAWLAWVVAGQVGPCARPPRQWRSVWRPCLGSGVVGITSLSQGTVRRATSGSGKGKPSLLSKNRGGGQEPLIPRSSSRVSWQLGLCNDLSNLFHSFLWLPGILLQLYI